MKATLILAAALAAGVNGAVIEPRQRGRPTSRPSNPGGPDVSECGLDAFVGHTSEARLFCSSILKGGTSTLTSTATATTTVTQSLTVTTTLSPPSRAPTPTASPTVPGTPTSAAPPSSTPTAPGCGIVGYTKSTAAYYFDSSGTKNTWAACSAQCKSDSKCKSFGYGEANCLLFDVYAADNTNYNPMSPYTFYDQSCPKELPVKKRQVNITLDLPPAAVSSACSCLITSAPAGATTTVATTTTVKTTKTATITKTVSLANDQIN